MLNKLSETLCKQVPSHKFKSFDGLGMSCIPYYVYFVIMSFGFFLYDYTHNCFTLLFLIYAVIPLLD
jgi:hypothetical protein